MKLLVGSVFIDDSPAQERWLDLQLKFLSQTTEDFEHVAVVWKQETGAFLKKTWTISPPGAYQHSEAHAQGLNYLLTQCNEYDHCLILDSDAFPIVSGWMPKLLKAMDGCEIATAIRPENLEQRFHASILFSKTIPHGTVENGVVGANLAGNLERDVHLPYYQEHPNLVFPLLRSNGYNVHPVACGLYYNMFYHHCCGAGRGNLSNQYWRVIGREYDANMLTFTERLMSDPEEFINTLKGDGHG